jgi:hypothetical protein
MQGPVYAEFSSYTRVKPTRQQNDSCSIFRTNLWKTITEVITSWLARDPDALCYFDPSPRSRAIYNAPAFGLLFTYQQRVVPHSLIFWNHAVRTGLPPKSWRNKE